jgi:hypothetical protein
MFRYPECAYGGDFYCDHGYDPQHPWQWADFRFFHSKKKIYFAVAMTTVEHEACYAIEEAAYALANFPPFFSGPYFAKDKKDGTIISLEPLDFQKSFKEAKERNAKIQAELSVLPVSVLPKIKVKDYGNPVVGLHVTVNTPHIDEHVIRDFIRFFRSLGEPTKPGWEWEGEKVAVVTTKFFKNPENS